MTVAVLTDSAASLPADLAAERGVTVVPLGLTVDGTPYDDGALPLADVLARPAESVTTSGPTPGRVAVALDKALAGADTALVLTIARSMSGTYEAARLGARDFGDRVRVVDTATAAGAEGLVVLAAASAAATGAGLDDVEAAARLAIERVHLVATVDGLDRLVHSGRVPGIAGWAGDKLGVNPVFEFRDGKARPQRPAFSRGAALERIEQAWARSEPGDGSRLHVAALHAGSAAEADRLLATATSPASGAEVATAFVGEFSPVMVTHTGDGLVGLAWWWEPAF